MGALSSVVGPAELVSGVKSEKRVPSATRTVPARNRLLTATNLARSRDILILSLQSGGDVMRSHAAV